MSSDLAPVTLALRTFQYLRAPGRVLRIAGTVAAISTLVSPLFTHPTLRNITSGLGAAVMLWWLGFQVRERTEEMAELTRPKPDEKLPPGQ